MEPTPIFYIAMIGDSLTDRGTLNNRYLFGCIPMSLLSGLRGLSPGDSFTNGLPWSDHLIAALANEFSLKKISREKSMDAADLADAIITHDASIYPAVNNFYNLKNDKSADYNGQNFVRTYSEGGLTAYDYSWWPSKSISRFFSRLILSTLEKKRKELFAYDQSHHLSKKQKAHTLIIEWSGANDLITVNEKPSKPEVDRAIKARIKNLTELIKNGYRHFVLFNLPDLSLTPRYQNKEDPERENARACSYYFNNQLELACKNLKEQYPYCSIDIFDANKEFTNMYHHPEKYYLEKAKKNLAYTKSADFKILPNGTSPAKGYMFWDDVHPTADVHALLAYKFCELYRNKFNFLPPPPYGLHRAHAKLRQRSTSQSNLFSAQTQNKEDYSDNNAKLAKRIIKK